MVNWGKKNTILNGSPQFPVQEVWRREESPYFWGVPHGRGPVFGAVHPFFPQQDISSDPWASLHPCLVRGCLCSGSSPPRPSPTSVDSFKAWGGPGSPEVTGKESGGHSTAPPSLDASKTECMLVSLSSPEVTRLC